MSTEQAHLEKESRPYLAASLVSDFHVKLQAFKRKAVSCRCGDGLYTKADKRDVLISQVRDVADAVRRQGRLS